MTLYRLERMTVSKDDRPSCRWRHLSSHHTYMDALSVFARLEPSIERGGLRILKRTIDEDGTQAIRDVELRSFLRMDAASALGALGDDHE